MLRTAVLTAAVAVAMSLGPATTSDAIHPAPNRTAVAVPDVSPVPTVLDEDADRAGSPEPTVGSAPETEPEPGPDPDLPGEEPLPGEGDGAGQPATTRPATTVAGADQTENSEPDDTSVDDTADDSDDDTVSLRVGGSPQVRTSQIPLGSTILALLVLGGVGLVLFRLARRDRPSRLLGRAGGDELAADAPSAPAPVGGPSGHMVESDSATIPFLLGLGESLIDAGDAVSHVETTLHSVARVNGVDDVGVIVLPTALIVSVPGGRSIETEVSIAGRSALRLDQIDDVLTLVGEAERGDVDAIEGQRRLAEIRRAPPPFGPPLAVAGYVTATVGLALVLHAGWLEVVLAAALGLVIGVLRLSTRHLGSSYQPFIPLIAAASVSVAVFSLARVVDDLVTFPLLISPLITFLPGAVLTMGVLELATGQIISGAARLASGAMQLVLLGLGIVAGGQLVGVPTGDLHGDFDGPIAVLAPWLGVGMFGVGVVWFYGARATARGWIVLVLYIAFAGQVVGGLFFGSGLSAFFGAAAMTPVAILASRQPTGPTPLVLFLPGFWILVPGALGLEGVASLLGEDGASGAATVVTTVTSMVGVSLGILLGLIASTADPDHPWVEVDTVDR